MTSRHTEGKVRDFELTMEDAERLARCFNSFDDSDSWPQGFTQGNPFTGERLLDDLAKRKKIRTIVAYSGDKIVGHCDVINAELDEEACYVGLLGADPAYHGQGYGKAMLIEAAETAARHGKRRIDLHTWGGNLKAMPLYKRTGYNWAPQTRVLMESHIPGIIGCELFGEFFEKHYWYDAYKRKITQEMDDVVEDGIGVFNYRFEGDNGDSLDVSIDREAKGIASFSLTVDGKTVSAAIKSQRHYGFIGIDTVPVEFSLTNGTNQVMSYSLEIIPTDNTVVDFDRKQSGELHPGESQNVEGTYSIDYGAIPIDREMNPDEKVHTQAEWLLTLDGKTIALYSGLIPKEPITLSSGPAYPYVSPGEKKTVGLGLQNNTDQPVQGEVVIKFPSELDYKYRTISFELDSSEESEIDIEITGSLESSVVVLDISVSLDIQGNLVLVNARSLSVGVIGPAGAYAHRSLDNHYVVENENLRLTIRDQPPHVFRTIENKILGEYYGGWGLIPYLGYPLPSGGNEWERKKFDVRLVNDSDFAAIELEAESVERPGVIFTISYGVYPGRDYIEIKVGL
ncbi:MAG: GNAT family N-acetyltransferase, partial [Candidatus Thorarchaeota archaeon]